jgi:hypothetical protein
MKYYKLGINAQKYLPLGIACHITACITKNAPGEKNVQPDVETFAVFK